MAAPLSAHEDLSLVALCSRSLLCNHTRILVGLQTPTVYAVNCRVGKDGALPGYSVVEGENETQSNHSKVPVLPNKSVRISCSLRLNCCFRLEFLASKFPCLYEVEHCKATRCGNTKIRTNQISQNAVFMLTKCENSNSCRFLKSAHGYFLRPPTYRVWVA
jgi:hypothetical protein